MEIVKVQSCWSAIDALEIQDVLDMVLKAHWAIYTERKLMKFDYPFPHTGHA